MRAPRKLDELDPENWHLYSACGNCSTLVLLELSDIQYRNVDNCHIYKYRCPICARPVRLPDNIIPTSASGRMKLADMIRAADPERPKIVPDSELTPPQLQKRLFLRERQVLRRAARVNLNRIARLANESRTDAE